MQIQYLNGCSLVFHNSSLRPLKCIGIFTVLVLLVVEERPWVCRISASISNIWYWDLTTSPQDRLWFWSDGSKFDHESWAQGQPNNHNGAREPCIQINFGGTVSPLSFIKFNFFRVGLTNKCDLLFYFVFPLKLKTAGTMNHVERAIPPCAP